MRSLTILLAVLLLTGCDDPVAPTTQTELTVNWTGGWRLDDGRYIWFVGHDSPPGNYACQVSRAVADAVELNGDPFECEWRLIDPTIEEMEWDLSLAN